MAASRDAIAARVASSASATSRAAPAVSAATIALTAEFADDVAALPERVHVAFHRPDRLQRRAVRRQQLMLHRQEPFGDDVQPRRRHQVMDVGDPAGHRILDRDHAEIGSAVATAAKASSKVGHGIGS